MNTLENIEYITIASGSKFQDTKKIIKIGDICYFFDESGHLTNGEVFMIMDNAQQHYKFYSTKEVCDTLSKLINL